MRRVTISILMLALVVAVAGCSSVQFTMSEPQAAQLTFKKNCVFWESWEKTSTPLPAVLTLNTHHTYIYRISDIPLQEGLVIYARVKTYGQTEFAKAGRVPIVINEQDMQDVRRGNVVRIVVVDPKKEFQTSQFESLRLAPTDDALKRAKEIGKPLALIILGNREPKYCDLGAKRTATSY